MILDWLQGDSSRVYVPESIVIHDRVGYARCIWFMHRSQAVFYNNWSVQYKVIGIL